MRHGDAENTSILHPQDFERPLTERAHIALEHAVYRMPDVLGPLDRIISSPLMRARQTAELVSEGYDHDPMVELRDEFSGHSSPAALTNLLVNTMGHPQMLIVGHAPNVDQLVAYLVAPDEFRVVTRMSPGSLAGVEIDTPFERKGSLVCLIPLEAW
jgi:phosphohistidine phosphatase